MANILDRYGIKEVADVSFFEITTGGKRGNLVLYLDTLKVSTIEQTAENTSARGGKGNPEIISWDYGKEITVTLEDALFSAKSMAVMFGNGTVSSSTSASVHKTLRLTATTSSNSLSAAFGSQITMGNKTYSTPTTATVIDARTGDSATTYTAGSQYILSWDATASEASTITITADSFPGTYYVVGDTYARSEDSGEDEFFQFIIPKAKVTAENTITLEAEGDPSVFNLNLRVLRPSDGEMMKLVKYSLPKAGS